MSMMLSLYLIVQTALTVSNTSQMLHDCSLDIQQALRKAEIELHTKGYTDISDALNDLYRNNHLVQQLEYYDLRIERATTPEQTTQALQELLEFLELIINT